MTAIRFAASIVLGMVASTAAHAAEPAAASAPASPVVAAGSGPAVIILAAGPAAVAYKASPNARYCFRTERAGSFLKPKGCKTRAAWKALGFDFDRALAGRW